MNKDLMVNRISDHVTVIVVHDRLIISLWRKPLLVLPLSQVEELYEELKKKQEERNGS